MINEKNIHLEAHLDIENVMLSEVEKIYEQVMDLRIENHGINHVTLQAEVDTCCSKDLFKI